MSANTPNPYILDGKLSKDPNRQLFRAYDTVITGQQADTKAVVVNYMAQIVALSDKNGPKGIDATQKEQVSWINPDPVTSPGDIRQLDRYKSLLGDLERAMQKRVFTFLTDLVSGNQTFGDVQAQLRDMAGNDDVVTMLEFSEFGMTGVDEEDPAITKSLPLQQSGITARINFINTLCQDLANYANTLLVQNKMNVSGTFRDDDRYNSYSKSFTVGVDVVKGSKGLNVIFTRKDIKVESMSPRRVTSGH